MANKSGHAYGLTALIPIIQLKKDQDGSLTLDTVIIDQDSQQSHASKVRELLQEWPGNQNSPMAVVPNTYLCRFYVLNDVFYEGSPAKEDHLKSKYLVFSSNFHDDADNFDSALTNYLQGMWSTAQTKLQEILEHCVDFKKVKTTDDFVEYIKRCQVDNSLFFNGSTDDSLKEQLKALYLKQAFSHFVFTHQALIQSGQANAAKLQQAFKAFIEFSEPNNLTPTWTPGSATEPDNLAQDIANLST